jgi:hypothetical protein
MHIGEGRKIIKTQRAERRKKENRKQRKMTLPLQYQSRLQDKGHKHREVFPGDQRLGLPGSITNGYHTEL